MTVVMTAVTTGAAATVADDPADADGLPGERLAREPVSLTRPP